MTDLLDLLTARGFVQDATAGLAERLAQGPITAYVGFDPTADSLHVGSMVPVDGAGLASARGAHPDRAGGRGNRDGRRSQREASRAPGDATRADRPERAGASAASSAAFSFEGANAARLRNNADWLRNIRLMDFLRDTGKHFTVGYMLQKESVSSRMEEGISYTEFSYMLVQAYDFWHLFRTEGCELQLGGSDQWGNITAGTDLVDKRERRQVHGLVFPLITSATGAKFGKSEAGNVWLDPERTSPYHFYQYWVNADDRDVERFLKLFTFLRLDRITAAMEEHAIDPGKRTAQKMLAREVTSTVHGEAAAEQAIQTSEALFGGRAGTGEGVTEMPERRVSRSQMPSGLQVIDVLMASGLATSKADARRGIQGKGFYLNGEPIESVDLVIDEGALQGPPDAPFMILRKGKRNYVRLVVEP